jgi:DNA polymerase-3 subunit alpha
MKANYPVEFLAATMTLDMGNTDKLNEFRQDARKHGIEIVPPCVNRSDAVFNTRDGKVFYAIGAVKGVGMAVAEHIVEARAGRPFKDLGDFASRVDARIVNRRTLEALINAGAFDQLAPRREQAFAAIDAIVATAHRTNANAADGIVDMFASSEPEPIKLSQTVTNWLPTERLEREFGAIGFHLSGHPLDQYADLFERLRVTPWSDFEHAVKEAGATAGRLAGTIGSRNDRRTKKGMPMCILSVSDASGGYEVIAFSEQVSQYSGVLQPGANVVLNVEADERPDGINLRLVSAEPIAGLAEKVGKRLTVFAGDAKCLAPIRSQLKLGGEGLVSFIVIREAGLKEYEIELKGKYRLTPELTGSIKAMDGVVDARLS